jgi:hypothetical protein
MSTADAYQRLRPLMFSIAYRMLGSWGDPERTGARTLHALPWFCGMI